MNRENLVQINGPAEAPPAIITELAADEDGNLYKVRYAIESIEATDDPDMDFDTSADGDR